MRGRQRTERSDRRKTVKAHGQVRRSFKARVTFKKSEFMHRLDPVSKQVNVRDSEQHP